MTPRPAANARSRRRSPWAAALAALLGVTVSLALAEVAVRVVAPQAGTFTGHGMYLADPDLGYRLRPDHRWGKIETNGQGLRDVSRQVTKTAGTKRVLVLGDSFAFGSGMALEDTFARQLQARLRDGVEVINAGIPGYSTAQQRIYLDKFGVAYEPDVVVVAFFVGNDLWENLGTRRTKVVDGELMPEDHEPPSFIYRQAMRSHLFRLFRGSVAQPVDRHEWYLSVETKRMDVCALPGKASEDLEPGWRVARESLQGIRARVAPRPVVVLAIPDEFQVSEALREEVFAALAEQGRPREDFDLDLPQRRLAKICAELELQLVDPLPALRARAGQGEVLYLVDDSHWDARGNALAVDALLTAPALEGLAR